MKQKVVFVLLFLFITVFFVRCIKEYSYEGGLLPGTPAQTPDPNTSATYTLTGAPGLCESFELKGEYVAGQSLTAINTVSLKVNVTTAGKYNIQTDTINDISFSAAGEFTATGIQTVILKGSGTPKRPQTVTLKPSVPSSSCTFDIEVINAQPLGTYVLESGYGNPNPCVATVFGNYAANTALGSSNKVNIQVFAASVGNFTVATNTVNGMSFYYTGSFTSAGTQTITLIGEGKPIGPGTFVFTPQIVGPHPLGGQSCSFSITVN